jgi:predicted transcriptional regulator
MTVQAQGQRVQLSLDVSPELYQTLNSLAQQLNGDTADVLVKAISLLKVAVEAEKEGKRIWIANQNQELDTEIVGIFQE